MPKPYVIEDKSESIMMLAFKNDFFKTSIEDINNLDDAKLKIFFNLVLQLESKEFFKYALNEVLDPTARASIEKIQEAIPKVPMSYGALQIIGFKIGDENLNSFPVSDVLTSREKKILSNRGVVKNNKGTPILKCNAFAEYLVLGLRIVREGQNIYAYDNGIYILLQDIELKKICRKILCEAGKELWKTHKQNEYINALKMELREVSELKSTKDLWAFNNGFLDLRSGEFNELSPDYFFNWKHDFDYDPKAQAPRFRQFLHEISKADLTLTTFMEEMLGYLLLEDKRIHKLYIFKGTGSNGKSVLIKIIEDLLGVENVSTTPLNKLQDRFGFQALENKLVNISSENELGNKNIDTENIKAITGGDRVEVEKKNQDSYSAELNTRLIISVNNDFTFSDTSHGILRRLLFVPFDVRFFEKPSENSHRVKGRMYQDTNLPNDLRKEMNGIFNIAYEGLKRLIANDYVYTESDRSREEVERYIRYSNPISAFIDEEMDMGVDLETSKSDINKFFASWQIKNAGEYKSITASAAAGLVKTRIKDLSKHVLEKKVNGSRVLEGVGLKAKRDIHMVPGCQNKRQDVPAVI